MSLPALYSSFAVFISTFSSLLSKTVKEDLEHAEELGQLWEV